MAEDIAMPLDVMLHTMRHHWREGRIEEAIALAKAAAPYLHAKPGAGRIAATLGALRDDELDELCKQGLGAGGGPGGATPAKGDTE